MPSRVYHLPAYLALERWVLARRVVVIQPSGPEGPRRMLAAGARQVLVIGADFPSEPGMDVRPSNGSRLPLRDASIDVVVCLEAFGAMRPNDRRELLRDSFRVLRKDGMFCAWIEQRESEAFGRTLAGSSQVDFWGLEDEINAVFPRVDMMAQMPWQGFSLAPILDDEYEPTQSDDPDLALREELLEEAPEASHYLAIASKARPPAGLARECLLIPLPRDEVFGLQAERGEAGPEVEELRDELDRLREELSLRAAKVAAAHGRVRELEAQLESVRARSSEVEVAELERLRDALTEAETQLSILRARTQEQGSALARLEDERAELVTQLETARSEQTSRGADVATTEAELRGALEQARERAREASDRLREADEKLRSQATDLQILTRTSAEQDKAVERLTVQLETERAALEGARAEASNLRERLDALDSEREELRRQNEVYVAEREGARKLAQRMEAELDVASRRATQQDDALASNVKEASRLAGELDAMHKRLEEAEVALAHTRTRAEELSATAAQGAEQGRMLADVAVDRDRLREQLSQRARQIEALEARVWETREALQKERLDGVRATAEVERLREQLERARDEEQRQAKAVEAFGRELRELEVANAAATALLKAREEQIERFEKEAAAIAGQSADVDALRRQLHARNREVAQLSEQLAAVEAREEQTGTVFENRKRDLEAAREKIVALQAELTLQSGVVAEAHSELEVRQFEVGQLTTTLESLQAQLEEAREQARAESAAKAAVQQELEEAAAVRDSLRRQLLDRERELDRLSSQPDASPAALLELRRELEEATAAADRLEAGETEDGPGDDELARWPDGARQEVQRLRAALARVTRDHARERASARLAAPGSSDELRQLRLEIQVRTTEQEFMLTRLDAAEQEIWEMTDAADRNAARFAASLAQLEKHKETVDALLDELEVTRNLLAAEQARALEQERLLASERAKMARAGIGVEGFPVNLHEEEGSPFSDIEKSGLLSLGEEPKPRATVASGKKPSRDEVAAGELERALASMTDDDEPSSVPKVVERDDSKQLASGVPSSRPRTSSAPMSVTTGSGGNGGSRPRMTVEAVDDDEWPEE